VRGPLVSVVIPAYNAASFIGPTLDSVFAQTLSDYEVIVVNDGSPDTSSLERALEPLQSKIRYLKQANGGPSNARNTGIRAAVGKYVAFLDSDDLWLPHHLARQVEHLESDPSLQMVYANGVYLRGDSPVGILFDNSEQSLPIDLDCLLQERSTVITSSTVVLREALLKAGMFDEKLRRCEDYDLWLRLVQAGFKLSFTREIQIRHRQSNGLAANWELMRQALIDVYHKHLALGSLTAAQTEFVRSKMHNIATAIDVRHTKQSLLEGKFTDALERLGRVQASDPSWKFAFAQIGLRRFPHLLQSAYRFYLRRAERLHLTRSSRALKNAGFDGVAGNEEGVLTRS
jgi:glycosyltransferase involved in cell wall biosynthesis